VYALPSAHTRPIHRTRGGEAQLPVRGLQNPSRPQIIPWGVQRVGAPQAWARSRGTGIRVAVIDTGLDLNHPDLAANIEGGINFVTPGRPPQDDNGHGTHVGGTIA